MADALRQASAHAMSVTGLVLAAAIGGATAWAALAARAGRSS